MSGAVFPPAAIEAAALALFDHTRLGQNECMCGWVRPGFAHSTHQAALVLEAAAPHMLAEAWDEAIQSADDEGLLLYHQTKGLRAANPYRSDT